MDAANKKALTKEPTAQQRIRLSQVCLASMLSTVTNAPIPLVWQSYEEIHGDCTRLPNVTKELQGKV